MPGKAVGLAMFRIRVSHFASVAAALSVSATGGPQLVVLNYL